MYLALVEVGGTNGGEREQGTKSLERSVGASFQFDRLDVRATRI